MKHVIVLVVFFLLMFPFQNEAQCQTVLLSLQTTLEVTRNLSIPDEKDVFDFKVNAYGKLKSKVAIAFFVDGVLQQEYPQQAWPTVFQYNFRGFKKGRHEIRVDVLDLDNSEKVLGRASAFVDV